MKQEDKDKEIWRQVQRELSEEQYKAWSGESRTVAPPEEEPIKHRNHRRRRYY